MWSHFARRCVSMGLEAVPGWALYNGIWCDWQPSSVPSARGVCRVDWRAVCFPTVCFLTVLEKSNVKKLEVRVPHGLNPAEVRRRLDEALVKAREQPAEAVGEINAQWEDEDRLRFMLMVMGMKFDGQLEIQMEELLVQLELPGAAALFSGRIREGIQERLGGLIG